MKLKAKEITLRVVSDYEGKKVTARKIVISLRFTEREPAEWTVTYPIDYIGRLSLMSKEDKEAIMSTNRISTCRNVRQCCNNLDMQLANVNKIVDFVDDYFPILFMHLWTNIADSLEYKNIIL